MNAVILLFLADGFEEIEALTPVDVLRRAGEDVMTVAVGTGDSRTVTGSHGISVTADITSADAAKLAGKADAVILPGGMPGAKNLDADGTVDALLTDAYNRGATLAAICAAPMIPGKRGMLAGRRATCFPGFEKDLIDAHFTGGRVETDGNVITACGMGAATEFALAIVSKMKGERAAKEMQSSILAR